MKGDFCLKSVILVLAMGIMPIAGFSQQKKTVVKRPKLPIEYVEKYNVGAQDDKNNTSRYMSCNIASAKAKSDGTHVPKPEEWVGVFPLGGEVSFEDDDMLTDNVEYVMIKGETFEFTADYQRNMRTCYAIRLISEDNLYRCAYRYKKIGSFRNDNNLNSGVEVSVIYLGPSFKGSLKTIANENYWNANKSKIIRRYFPASGICYSNDTHIYGHPVCKLRGHVGYFWSDVISGVHVTTVTITGSGIGQTLVEGWNDVTLRSFTNE